ncbi:MAG: hypothetical protein ACYST6_06945 [Planctomycetota bacterium]|jgi:hypothetical protein
MKTAAAMARVLFPVLLLSAMGCEQSFNQNEPVGDEAADRLSVYKPYMAARLEITPLTGFASAGGGERPSRIQVYVSVLDSFDCEIKSPGTFRFELYERVDRSSEPKGARIALWPDVDLADGAENNSYWRDFLRAYEFNLDFEPQNNRRYILDITFVCPVDRRLSDDYVLEYAP